MRLLREHIGLQKCWTWVKDKPGHLVGFLVVLGVIGWFLWPSLAPWLSSTPPRPRYATAALPPLVAPLPDQRDKETQAYLKDQRSLEDIQADLKAGAQEKRDLRQALLTKETEHKQALMSLSQKLEGVEKRLAAQQEQAARTPAPPSGPARAPAGPTAREKQLQDQITKLMQQMQQHGTAGKQDPRYGTMQVYTPKPALDIPVPPSPNRADIPYLGVGCVGPFTLAVGGDSTVETERSSPVLLSFTEPFRCASQLQGPGQLPRLTEIPVQGCLALAAVRADIAAGRATGETTQLACTMPDGAYFERPFRAFLVGEDSNRGLVGEVIRHETAKLFAAGLTSIMQEASALLTAARSQVVITGTPGSGSGQQYFSGIQSGFNQMTTFLLEQARHLRPTVFVHRGQRGYVVVLEGLSMEGVPMTTTVSMGR